MSTAAEDYREHVAEANRLLARAAEFEAGPKCHLAKTYAAMAQAHVGLAQLAQVELLHTPARFVMPGLSTESDTGFRAKADVLSEITNSQGVIQ